MLELNTTIAGLDRSGHVSLIRNLLLLNFGCRCWKSEFGKASNTVDELDGQSGGRVSCKFTATNIGHPMVRRNCQKPLQSSAVFNHS